jgi:hypothetical protein
MVKTILCILIVCSSLVIAQQDSFLFTEADYDKQAKDCASVEAKGKKRLRMGMFTATVKRICGEPPEAATNQKGDEMWAYVTSIS